MFKYFFVWHSQRILAPTNAQSMVYVCFQSSTPCKVQKNNFCLPFLPYTGHTCNNITSDSSGEGRLFGNVNGIVGCLRILSQKVLLNSNSAICVQTVLVFSILVMRISRAPMSQRSSMIWPFLSLGIMTLTATHPSSSRAFTVGARLPGAILVALASSFRSML